MSAFQVSPLHRLYASESQRDPVCTIESLPRYQIRLVPLKSNFHSFVCCLTPARCFTIPVNRNTRRENYFSFDNENPLRDSPLWCAGRV